MSFTNINILNKEHTFKYVLEYKENEIETSSVIPTSDWKWNNNVWESSLSNEDFSSSYVPSEIKISNVTLYFPDYSVDTYENGLKYALTINTWINDKYIELGSFIISRNDCEAADTIKTFYNQKYYEKYTVTIINPKSIIYDEEWKGWRENVCGVDVKGYELNNTGSLINFSLHPVVNSGDIYTKVEKYDGGQNAINLSKFDSLSYSIKFNDNLEFEGNVSYNEAYNKDFLGFEEYLKETYNIDTTKPLELKYEFYIQDKEDLFFYKEISNNDTNVILQRTDITYKDENEVEYPLYTKWVDFKPGLVLNGTLNILVDGEVVLTIMSNSINLTQDIFRFLIQDGSAIDNVKLSDIIMDIYNINTVNKIQQNIIQVDRPSDYKSNIVKPVYYRTRDIANVVFHPEVTENICINLDAYKSSVKSFILRLEGINFGEKARVSSGVIFRINGNYLPKTNKEGIYYILNQDSELITTGKYIYES
jgi:hypothetical protein